MDKWIKENRITTAIILVLVVVLAVVYFGKQPAKTSLNTFDVDLQTKCASSAKTFFEYYIPDPQERQNDEYSNHFNTKLNKCFVLVKKPTLPYATSGGNLYEKDLYDAIEKKQYGRYEWQSKSSVFSRDGFLAACAMFPEGDSNNFKLCSPQNKDFDSSEMEFDNFVKGYMEN